MAETYAFVVFHVKLHIGWECQTFGVSSESQWPQLTLCQSLDLNLALRHSWWWDPYSNNQSMILNDVANMILTQFIKVSKMILQLPIFTQIQFNFLKHYLFTDLSIPPQHTSAISWNWRHLKNKCLFISLTYMANIDYIKQWFNCV